MSAKKLAMTAELREGTGKGTARAIRREKKIPAVIYGDKKEPVTISLNAKDFTLEYKKGHLYTTLIDVTVDGKKEMVLTRDIQTHPVTDFIIHADFLRVSAKTKIAVDVPVHFINEEKSPALESRGILNVVRHTIELYCQATNIPEQVEVNLEGKEYGDSVNLSDATLPDGTSSVIDDRDFTIATIVEPREEEEESDDEVEAGDVPAMEQVDGENEAQQSGDPEKEEA
jgi:large subunit ribosomal protein L25